MRIFIEWSRRHPIWMIAVLIVACFAGTILSVNAAAEARWQRYAAAAQARGVKLQLVDFARPPVPDAQNFAKVPLLQTAFSGGAKAFDIPRGANGSVFTPDHIKGVPINWDALAKHFVAQGLLDATSADPRRDVLRALETFAPQVADWEQWKVRPDCRFALNLKQGAAMPLPHLSSFQSAAYFFALRTRAHLALGESAAAYTDFRNGLQAYRALIGEPTLISALVQMASLNLVLGAVGDGLHEMKWAPAELEKIAADLEAVRIWDDYALAFNSERGFGNSFMEDLIALGPLARSRQLVQISGGVPGVSGGTPITLPPLLALIPKALYRNNQLRMNQHQDEIAKRAGPRTAELDPDTVTATSPDRLEGFDQYYFFLFRLSAPVFSEIIKRFIITETKLRQARTAVALERFRLERGAFPQTLGELAPQFLAQIPGDLHAAAPMHYRPRDGGTFLLYAIGRDRADDGGVIDPKLSENRQRDLVWVYAPGGN